MNEVGMPFAERSVFRAGHRDMGQLTSFLSNLLVYGIKKK